jgi:hypothetical protein
VAVFVNSLASYTLTRTLPYPERYLCWLSSMLCVSVGYSASLFASTKNPRRREYRRHLPSSLFSIGGYRYSPTTYEAHVAAVQCVLESRRFSSLLCIP